MEIRQDLMSFIGRHFGRYLILALLALGGPLLMPETEAETSSGMKASPTSHPLDDLNAEEIARTVQIIRSSGQFSPEIRYVSTMTLEPTKQELLGQAAESIPRQGLAILYDNNKNELWEVKVNLQEGRIVSSQLQKGQQPPLLLEEYDIAPAVIEDDPRWQAALKKRGINDPKDVYVDVWAPGLLSPKEAKSNKRLVRIVAFLKADRENVYARPIEGLIITVDVNAKKVVDIWDTEVVRLPSGGKDLSESANAPLRKGLKPLQIVQPEGPSFSIEGQLVKWQNWSFRYQMNPLKGLIIHQVHYNDRPILYKGHLSEMVVPYGDPEKTWSFRSAFDVGEYGIGWTAHPMVPVQDLPENAVYRDAIMADNDGKVMTIANAVAFYERDAGLLWKHFDTSTEVSHVRRARQLIMTFMTTIGNYDYGIDWIFHQDGTLEVEVRLTGILLAKGIPFAQNPCEESCKHLVEPYISAPNHQHFFSFRLDMDVDGHESNVPVELNTRAVKKGKDNPYGNVFEMEQTYLKSEKKAVRDLNLATSRKWKVINEKKKNVLGHPVGYMLVPGENSVPYLNSTSSIRKRAAFINHHIWFTSYRQEEQSAAGDYPNMLKVDDGLSKWIKNNEGLDGADVVMWYTMGVTHVTRPEEWPVMNVHRLGFKLMPHNFFHQNPAMDVPVSK